MIMSADAWQLVVERRLTVLEQQGITLRETSGKMDKRVSRLEWAAYVTVASLAAMGHEKMPLLVNLLAEMVKASAR